MKNKNMKMKRDLRERKNENEENTNEIASLLINALFKGKDTDEFLNNEILDNTMVNFRCGSDAIYKCEIQDDGSRYRYKFSLQDKKTNE